MTQNRILIELLQRFEAGLDPRRPERSAAPARVLGYGEISTVFGIEAPEAAGWAFKRMPMFRDEGEAQAYEALYRTYIETLSERIGLHVAMGDTVRVADPAAGRVVLYIIQEQLPPESFGHRAIHVLPTSEVTRLVQAVLAQSRKVFAFNQEHQGILELGLDGQISNWAIAGLPPTAGALPPEIELIYLDTSTPLMRRNGQEQLDPELLMRSAPSFTLWLLRRAFLPEVMTRYYDFRRVAMDLVANFYKEGRPELVPALVETVNRFFQDEFHEPRFKPLEVGEIKSYYRFDALTWRVFLALRKLDRRLHTVRGRPYPYILPAKIAR